MEILACIPRWPDANPVLRIARESGYSYSSVKTCLPTLARYYVLRSEVRRVDRWDEDNRRRAWGIDPIDWAKAQADVAAYRRGRL